MADYRLSLDFTAANDRQAQRLGEAWAGTCAAEYGTRNPTVTPADGSGLLDRCARAERDLATVMRIVTAWCVEYNDVGGVDAGDLAWRLQEAGYPLPDPEEDTTDA